MSRIKGAEAKRAGLVVRIAYWLTRRKFGRVMQPVRVTAHQPRLLRAVGSMEMGQEAARKVDARLKMLAQVKTAMLIGCPF